MNGEGSGLNNIKALDGRAKRKTITQIMMLNLITIAQGNGDSELEILYWEYILLPAKHHYSRW